jgi:hypothetical protein
MNGSRDDNFDTFHLHFGTETEHPHIGDGVYCPVCGDETYGNNLCHECELKIEDEKESKRYAYEHKHFEK